MKTASTRNLALCLTLAVTGCVYGSWYRASYIPDLESFEYGMHCDPAVRQQLADHYVGNHFIHINLFGSDRTTLTETAPYRLVVSATSLDLEEGYMRIHGIRLGTAGGEPYTIWEMQSLGTSEPVAGPLPFTLALQESKQINFCAERRNRDLLPVSRIIATTDQVLDLTPEDGKVIQVEVDVEIQQAGRSERRTIRYQLHPEVRKRRFIPLTQ